MSDVVPCSDETRSSSESTALLLYIAWRPLQQSAVYRKKRVRKSQLTPVALYVAYTYRCDWAVIGIRKLGERDTYSNGIRVFCNGDEASQWKSPNFDPSPLRNPLTELYNNMQHVYVTGGNRHATCRSCRLVQGVLLTKYMTFPRLLLWAVFLRYWGTSIRLQWVVA